MRIASFSIRNYKGIALAELANLDNESVVTISGRNGTGKSLLLEALVAAWSNRHSLIECVGSWGDTVEFELSVSLTDGEWAEVERWRSSLPGAAGPVRFDGLHSRSAWTRMGSASSSSTPGMEVLRDQRFQRHHPFAIIDFLPASRLLPAGASATVDLEMLNIDRIESERRRMVDEFLRSGEPVYMPSVSNYLVTLDYQGFLAQRQQLPTRNEYEVLQNAFFSTTGKELLLPEFDPARGSHIEVRLPTGQQHGLGDLSSGEQEMLSLMYFVRRLSASGGVLLIDEPEQHLHPTLQASLFEAMRGLADRAQVFVVSHSVNLIAASPMTGLVQLQAAVDPAVNQASRLNDNPTRVQLMADLGITAADLTQSDMLLVVEGETDSKTLRTLFPVELGRAHIVVAGSAKQVVAAHDTLGKYPQVLPWLCVRDRDLMDDAEAASLCGKYPRLYIWPRRAIESMLVDVELMVATMRSAGASVSSTQVATAINSASSSLRDEVLWQLVESALRTAHPIPKAPQGSRHKMLEERLRSLAQVNLERAESLELIAREQEEALNRIWGAEWVRLVDPKALLGQVHSRLGVFRTLSDFLGALAAKARDDADVRPEGLESFREAIVELLH